MCEKGRITKACRFPGCSRAILLSEKYCPEHKHYERNRWGDRRKQKLKFLDTQRWRRLKEMVLRANPMCARCNTAAADVVHHKLAAREHPELRFDIENLEPLCHRCHNKETAREMIERRG